MFTVINHIVSVLVELCLYFLDTFHNVLTLTLILIIHFHFISICLVFALKYFFKVESLFFLFLQQDNDKTYSFCIVSGSFWVYVKTYLLKQKLVCTKEMNIKNCLKTV